MNKEAFKGLGTKVMDPEQFIGRTYELQLVVNKVRNENILITGLPRIGKSSLAYQALLSLKHKCKEEGSLMVDIWFDVSQTDTPKQFFNQLSRMLHDSVVNYLPEDKQKEEKQKYDLAIKGKVDTLNIVNYFSFVDKLGIQIIICFDEFDAVRSIGLERHHCGCLHSILDNVSNIRTIITSKRLLVNLEKIVCSTSNPSKLHSLYNTQIFLKPYNNDELECYWKRLSPYLAEKGISASEQYKSNSEWYSGNVPYFLDIFNDFFLSRNRSAEEFIYRMDQIFHQMVVILEEQGLLSPALQVIVGPFYDCKKDQITELKHYGFIKECSIEEKEENFGITTGLIENEKTYVCISDYLTHRFRSAYKLHAPFWPAWENTLLSIKRLVNDYILQNAGSNWESQKSGPFCKQMIIARQKDIDKGIPVSNSLSDYLMERDLIGIITEAWNTFNKVFPMSKDDFVSKMNEILPIRNHLAHVNGGDMSKDKLFMEKKTEVCVEISNLISLWYEKSDKKLCDYLINDLVYTPYEDVVEIDNNSNYHIGPYCLVEKIGAQYLGIRKKVISATFNTQFNSGYLYFANRII